MLRFLGSLFLGLGLATLAADLIIHGRLRATGEWWFALHPGSLQVAQPAIERHVAPWLWDPVLQNVLLAPVTVVAFAVGVLLLALRSLLR